jgi:hypothetical protein
MSNYRALRQEIEQHLSDRTTKLLALQNCLQI